LNPLAGFTPLTQIDLRLHRRLRRIEHLRCSPADYTPPDFFTFGVRRRLRRVTTKVVESLLKHLMLSPPVREKKKESNTKKKDKENDNDNDIDRCLKRN
jgi:hypothetical protein